MALFRWCPGELNWVSRGGSAPCYRLHPWLLLLCLPRQHPEASCLLQVQRECPRGSFISIIPHRGLLIDCPGKVHLDSLCEISVSAGGWVWNIDPTALKTCTFEPLHGLVPEFLTALMCSSPLSLFFLHLKGKKPPFLIGAATYSPCNRKE